MPIAGPRILPSLAASTSKVPMIGPVQENETKASVKAMKKMLSKPVVFSAAESILLLHDSGRVISKAPKNEMANTTSNKKKMMLHTALVARALSELAPKIIVMSTPRNTYINMIESP